MTSYQLIFAGTPPFAAQTLTALIESRHTVKAVYTQPDRPAGRGQKLTASAVKQVALEHQLPVCQPTTLRNETEQAQLAAFNADLMIVVAYGLILPKAVLQAPRFGCLNVHASLLPRWRGAAPIQRAILAGDDKTGVTIMQMDEGLDTGGMLLQVSCAIRPDETSQSLYDRLAELGAKTLLETLNQLPSLSAQVQNNAQATYAQKIAKEEAKIDWTVSAKAIDQQIRAFYSWPVAFTAMDGSVVRVWGATVLADHASRGLPGTIEKVSADGIDVITGDGILRLTQIQLPGGKVLSAANVVNAHRALFQVNKLFETSQVKTK